MTLEETLGAAVDRLWPEYRDLLASLVRIPSLTGQERPAQEMLAHHIKRRVGLPVDLWDLDPDTLWKHPLAAPVSRSFKDRPNLTSAWRGTGNGRTLVLNGHIDVVPAEPVSWWREDPWGGRIDGGRLFGRGSGDMKAGLISELLAIHAAHETIPSLAGTVLFESVIEEETTGNGTLAARLRSGRVDGAIIAEPTGLQAQIFNPGVIWFEVLVVGKPSYVGKGGENVNAIQKAVDLIAGLRSLPDELNEGFSHPLYAGVDRPLTLNVGEIEAGHWPSLVPVECRFACRMSFPPDWAPEQAMTLVERRIAELATRDSWLAANPPKVSYPGYRAHGWELPSDSVLLGLLGEVYRTEVGGPLDVGPMFGTADSHYFDTSAGEQCVCFGPLSAGLHVPDEWVDLESTVTTAKVLAKLILEWCG